MANSRPSTPHSTSGSSTSGFSISAGLLEFLRDIAESTVSQSQASLDWNPAYADSATRYGFNNPRNLCYRNSIMVLLLHTPVIYNWIQDYSPCTETHTGTSCFSCCFSRLFKSYWPRAARTKNAGTQVNLNTQLRDMWNDILKPNWVTGRGPVTDSQCQDAGEFLARFLDLFEQRVPPRKPPVQHPCTFHVLRDMNVCTNPDCARVYSGNSRTEQNNILLGSAPPTRTCATATDVVEHYLRDEDASKPCDRCKAPTINRSIVSDPPDILFVSVNRLTYSSVKGRAQFNRINTAVIPPNALELDLRKCGSENVWYKLYGIVYHQGPVTGGHYNVAVKGPNGEWVKVDDTKVEKIEDWRSTSHCQQATLFAYQKMNGKPETIDETSGTAQAGPDGQRTQLEATIGLKGKDTSWDLQKSLELPEGFDLQKQKVKFTLKLTSSSGDVYEASADTILRLKKQQSSPGKRKRAGGRGIGMEVFGRKSKKS
ncbi:ubiquitin carboxyl-terminal hydrolase [Aspergillus sclerotialis]|uniref:Ubiquitin carboxyl-terminal hydrolase n=1 Tax=Aspergillus sclerotialis TaxID=2070753 RepID=A0A3A2ZKI2_9EURO|nr:ubiquitin carboxyl-terminal hydrolase [Aspergillus sclerotialis]